MDENGLPLTGAGVNYTAVEPINQRELVTYFNMFLARTCTFLNAFSTKCETKLADLSTRLDVIDRSITLLETKLNSVDELANVKLTDNPATTTTTAAAGSDGQSTAPAAPPLPPSSGGGNSAAPPPPPPPPPPPQAPSVPTISQDPRYAKYFTMIKMGVPLQAIKNKMALDGLNGDLLDTPDAPVPE